MTQLKGSEKQIAWAESIRTQMLERLSAAIAAQKKERDIANLRNYESIINDITSSAWFIENREAGTSFGKDSTRPDVWFYTFDGIREGYKKIFA